MSSQLPLDTDFQTFSSGKRFQYEVSQPTFDVSVACKIAFLPSDRATVLVEIDADAESLADFSVSQQGKTITIKQKGSSCSSGNIIVNGVLIDGTGNASSKPSKEPRIRVFAPQASSLEASLSGASILVSKVVFDRAEVAVYGIAAVGLAAKSASLDFSGSGRGFILLSGGDLEVDLSGQASVEINGYWGDAKIDLSGMAKVKSTGTCNGNYQCSVSGMGSVTHRGTIIGRVKKQVSGMGRIDL